MPANVIYARKSTESEDRQVLSIDSQVNELQSLAVRRGIVVADVLTEAHSAKAPGRPVFNQLMRRVHQGKVRAVLCWKMDRLARNHLDTGAILQALADGELEEVVTFDRTYTRDGNDRFMGNFELGMATKYIDDLRANTKRGNRARLARGWANCIPPLGYLNDKATKTIVKDPERFGLVRRMWDLMLTGAYRPEQIAKIANKQWGFRTRKFQRYGDKPLPRKVFYEMLGNPFYMGIIRLRGTGETFRGAHPPMVTRGEFDRVQELLGRPGRPRPQRHEFPYTGIMHCGTCGGAITAEEHVKKSGKRYAYYRCSRYRTGTPCREAPVSEAALEAQVVAILERLTIPESILAWILRQVDRTFRREDGLRQEARRALEDALSAVRREQDNLVTMRLKDMVGDDDFAARKRAIDERRLKLEAELAAPPRSRDELIAETVRAFTFAAKAAHVLRTGTRVQQRTIFEAVSLNPTLQSGKLRTLVKNPFEMIAEAGACHAWVHKWDDVRTWIVASNGNFYVPDFEKQSKLVESRQTDIYSAMNWMK